MKSYNLLVLLTIDFEWAIIEKMDVRKIGVYFIFTKSPKLKEACERKSSESDSGLVIKNSLLDCARKNLDFILTGFINKGSIIYTRPLPNRIPHWV